jgi:3-methyl-2-oxobutanoate hydroxymethyltransferase
MNSKRKKLTVPAFRERKSAGKRICVLTAYDFPTARLFDNAGVDAILVGDSMAMVIQGHETTLPVTLDEMIYHGRMVVRGSRTALVIVDLPFPTFHLGVHKAIELAGRVLKETHCQAVKLEGGIDQQAVIAGLVSAGIPVMAHVGLRPQNVHAMGGYKIQRDAEMLLADAQAAETAGAFAVVLECIPSAIAQGISNKVSIPTIGIGAGAGCDGQVLVGHDLLGLTTGYVPSFVKPYANLSETITKAVGQWCADVRDGSWPDEQHSFQ